MKILRTVFWSVIILFFTILMVKLTLPYFSFETDVDFLLTKQGILYNNIWLTSFYIHIGASPFVLLAGALQFNRYLLTQYPAVHRMAGKIYVLTVLLLSAPTGLIMSFYANGGLAAKISFGIISVLWWWFTWKSYSEIKKRKIESHKHYMIRSYALTLSAITLRIYMLVLPEFIHLRGADMYIFVSWLSWIPNLFVAEMIVRKRRN